MIKKTILLIILLVIGAFLLIFNFQIKQKSEQVETDLPKFAVSIYPLALILHEIAQNKIETIWISKDQGVHEVALKPDMITQLSKAKGIFVTGYSIDSWAQNIAKKINLSIFLVNKNLPENENLDNPHIWLYFEGIKTIAQNMLLVLEKLDPQNQSFYRENYHKFVSQLDSLRDEYQIKLAKVNHVPFLSYHDAFLHLFTEFNLNYQGSLIVAEKSLAPKELAALEQKMKQLNIRVIFQDSYEESPILTNFVNEYKLGTYFLDPLENGEIKSGIFSQLMKKNLETIYQALQNENLNS